MVYEHVVFDLDGTLIDSRADLAAAVNHVLRQLGRSEIVPDILYGYVGEGARVLVERALGAAGHELVPCALDLFLAHYGAHLLDHTRAYPGIVEVLAALRERGVSLSVLTNKPATMTRAILAGLGIEPFFIDLVGGDSLPTRKPDPAGLEHLRALSATPPARLLLVGDSRIDLETARAAGVAFCGVAWGLDPAALRAARVRPLIGHPAELLAVVEGAG